MQKSNVSVCIRARPLQESEQPEAFTYSPTGVHLLSNPGKSPVSFTFDHVFPPTTKTEEVYTRVAKPMIANVLEGYNATLFAYGQTTSGKTHTMTGTNECPGIIPLTAAELFRDIDKSDRVYRVWVSYLEIYNEVANDLLQPRSINLKLRENPTEGCYVLGLKQVRVYNASDILQVLEIGERNKHYRETKIHDHSSRSHSVFKLIVDSTERGKLDLAEDEETKKPSGMKSSVFNLVDLAGSERLNDSGAANIAETSHINKSLFVLTKVINKLADGTGGHIPYRDSKLTRILSTALGGNSLTSIICTLAPAVANLQLSLSTLRFASRAKSIVNRPVINEVLDDSELIESLRAQIRRLEKALADQEALCKLNHSRLVQENQELKAQLLQKQKSDKVLHEVKFINVEVSDLIAKHEELQRNFDIQLSLRTELLRENTELRNRGIIGFDVQKQRVESEKRDYLPRVREEWERTARKLRSDYLLEINSLDELFFEQMHQFFDSLPPSDQKENAEVPAPLSSQIRVKSSQQPQRKSSDPLAKLTPSKPPHRPGTSIKTIRSLIGSTKDTGSRRSRTRLQLSPQKKLAIPSPAKSAVYSPSPPLHKRKYMQLESDSDSDSGFSDGEIARKAEMSPAALPPALNNPSSPKTDDEVEEVRPEFLAMPMEELCTTSVGSVEIEPSAGSNVLLYGMNKEGCCGAATAKKQCTKPSPLSIEFQSVSLGNGHTAAIDYCGVAYTFGRGRSGQLGQGVLTSCNEPMPITHPLYAVPVKKVCCGSDHTICLTQEGEVYSWGFNGDGQLGLGDQYDRMRPYAVTYLDMKVKDVEAGYYHSAAITEEGALYTWGANPDGRLFRPPIRIRHQKFKVDTIPTKVHDIENVASAHLGKSHSILLTTEGAVFTAGSNNHGELGSSTRLELDSTIVQVHLFTKTLKAKAVSCGDSFSAVLTVKGQVFTFGKGGDGRLGLGDTRDRDIPECVSSSLKFKKMACGSRHVLAIAEDDEVYSWGCGTYSQLCTEAEDDLLVPTCVDLSSKTGLWARDVVSGHYHSALLTM